MTTQVTLKTTDGRTIKGVSFSVSPGVTTNPTALASQMQGGMQYGTYHILTAQGWVSIPASQVTAVVTATGAST